jgi:hypothetical protein
VTRTLTVPGPVPQRSQIANFRSLPTTANALSSVSRTLTNKRPESDMGTDTYTGKPGRIGGPLLEYAQVT